MEPDRLLQKRISIRRETRRHQLDEIFASKRRTLIQNLQLEDRSQPLNASQHNLIFYYQQLDSNRNVQLSLHKLSNLLNEQQPFIHFDKQGTIPCHALIQQYSLSLVQLICRKVIQGYRSDGEEDQKGRIACIMILLNLLADEAVDNAPLCGEVCGVVRQIYASLEIWGYDKQMEEVGFMMANLAGKDLRQCEEKDLETVLAWFYDLVGERTVKVDAAMLANIYRNLHIFVGSLQRKYRLESTQLPQMFKTPIVNILADTLTLHFHDGTSPSLLAKVINFIRNTFHLIVVFCPKEIITEIVKKIMYILGSISYNVVCSTLALLEVMVDSPLSASVPQYRKIVQSSQRVKLILVERYSQKLVQLLILTQIKRKQALIRFLHKMIDSPSPSTFQTVQNLSGAGLQQALFNLSQHNDQQLTQDCLHLGLAMSRLTDHIYGQGFLTRIQSHFSQSHKFDRPV